MGARAYRVLFAALSLPLATVAVVYFINHRYDGVPLWNLRGAPGVHGAVWVANFVSFFFLYPSTFNLLEARRRLCWPVAAAACLLQLLGMGMMQWCAASSNTPARSRPPHGAQVAAVDEPKLHMWETGVMRITRHPQALGQALWCAAHTAWIGSSFMVATSAALMAHHVFGCWHGDFRLRRKYGAVRRARRRECDRHISDSCLCGNMWAWLMLPKGHVIVCCRGVMRWLDAQQYPSIANPGRACSWHAAWAGFCCTGLAGADSGAFPLAPDKKATCSYINKLGLIP